MIVIYVCAQNFDNVGINTVQWKVFNIYDSAVRFAVPVFTMISGALFLDPNKQINIFYLYRKNILRMVIAFIFWSAVYAMIAYRQGGVFFENLLCGHYHMWYLFVIIGLYMAVPILRKIAESDNATKYFLCVSFVVAFVMADITEFSFLQPVKYIYEKMDFHLFLGYSSYFLLGYVLSSTKIRKRTINILYILGVIGYVVTCLGTAVLSYYNQSAVASMYNNFTVNVLWQSVAVFLFMKEHSDFTLPRKLNSFVRAISRCKFRPSSPTCTEF